MKIFKKQKIRLMISVISFILIMSLSMCFYAAEDKIYISGMPVGLHMTEKSEDGYVAGIGTLTFYNKETGCYGALGHGINGGKEELYQMSEGKLHEVIISGIMKGMPGTPGELKGYFKDIFSPVGDISNNRNNGIYGVLYNNESDSWKGREIEVGKGIEAHRGEAYILTALCDSTPKEYRIEISKINTDQCNGTKGLVIKVTDPELIEKTGGIVQGMSGSPIIQDGKLVGAVTHVLVNDPTRGYGIFIENMLEAAS